MNKLRFWRIERGIAQVDLAHLSGVSRAKIQLVEHDIGELNQSERIRVSTILGIPPEDLEPQRAGHERK